MLQLLSRATTLRNYDSSDWSAQLSTLEQNIAPFIHKCAFKRRPPVTMAPSTPAPPDDSHQQLLDQLDIASHPKPFKKSTWKPSLRRNKNIKQMLGETQRKEASVLATQNNSGVTTPLPETDGSATPSFPNGDQKPPNIAQAAQNLSTLVLEKNLQRAMLPSGPARLKGAIDSRIAEEQARQRSIAQNAALVRTPSGSLRRPTSRPASPAKRSIRPSEKKDLSAERGPDPSEFEPEFVIGDDNSAAPSGTATPRREEEKPAPEKPDGGTPAASENGSAPTTVEDKDSEVGQSEPLPADVQQKLRKLDRLEGRYQELLKAYRTAHAKVSTIEPFENALKENTPLTSINDPSSLTEYLNQLNLKGDMVRDELKRVTGERDDFRKKFEASDSAVSSLQEQVANLKSEKEASEAKSKEEGKERPSLEVSTDAASNRDDTSSKSATVHSPTPSQSSRVPSFSFFSPKTKAAKSPPVKESSEDFFSFDTEVPRLESELHERQREIDSLKTQLESLKRDLTVTRESTESMVESLESATRELHQLREGRDTYEVERSALQQKLHHAEDGRAQLESEKSDLEQRLEQQQMQAKDNAEADGNAKQELEKTLDALHLLESKLQTSDKSTEDLRARLSEKEATVKDLEDSLAMAKSDERQQDLAQKESDDQSKRIETINGILTTVRTQLQDAQQESARLQERLSSREADFESSIPVKVYDRLNIELKADNDWLASQKSAEASSQFLLKRLRTKSSEDEGQLVNGNRSQIAPETGQSTGSKKKNKKKKKGKGANDANQPEAPVKVTEVVEDDTGPTDRADGKITEDSILHSRVQELERQSEEKNAAIDRLSAKLRDQESMKEEIETLRDDLLQQGEEHVEARDKLKSVVAEKDALQKSIEELEKELAELKIMKTTGAAESEKAHQALTSEFEELKSQSTTLQTDLNAAQQLAAARFKDITDLRDLLSKAQPELRRLRQENKDMQVAKDDLKNKSGELNRLEARHEDLKAEMKGLSKRLGDKDAEIKSIQQENSNLVTTRSKAESELQMTQSDLRSANNSKQTAIESHEAALKDLSKAKEDAQQLRTKCRSLEEQIEQLRRETGTLQEEIQLKTAQHASAESLMSSMRDQTSEISTQMRESSARAEALEEELTETQRMLSERSREGDTMRRLLNDVEASSERKVREMKERMEIAVEERDRAEDEASTTGRRLAREMEDLRTKARDLTRSLKRTEDERDELEHAQADWRRRRGTLEEQTERSVTEVSEMRAAMAQLRDALDESERNTQDLERQRNEFRRAVEESQQRLEKLQKSNKSLAEEVKALQQQQQQQQSSAKRPQGAVGLGLDSSVPSSRSSLESGGGRIASPATRDRQQGRSETPTIINASSKAAPPPNVDYVYLKNVLLQFLEQRDKNHQKQLIPVLGMLLHFDR
ncbi:MAG: hypothetical protein Q9227_008258 [Pyrenula ochraceoflavens]